MPNKYYYYANNSGMESIYLLIPLFLLLVFTIPLIINIRLSFNLKNYTGIVSIYLFKIKIILVIFRLKDHNVIVHKKSKKSESEFELSDKQKRFFEQFIFQIKDKVNIKTLVSFTRIGTQDALVTSIYNGLINSLFAMIFGYVKNLKPYAKIDVVSYPAFNRELFLITLCGKISISFFDILYSFFMASMIEKRREKYEGI